MARGALQEEAATIGDRYRNNERIVGQAPRQRARINARGPPYLTVFGAHRSCALLIIYSRVHVPRVTARYRSLCVLVGSVYFDALKESPPRALSLASSRR